MFGTNRLRFREKHAQFLGKTGFVFGKKTSPFLGKTGSVFGTNRLRVWEKHAAFVGRNRLRVWEKQAPFEVGSVLGKNWLGLGENWLGFWIGLGQSSSLTVLNAKHVWVWV